MANSYTWKINYLDTALSENGLEKVVKSCRWSVDATDGEAKPTTASNYGYAEFSAPDAESFVAYDTLTEQQVLDWIWANGVDKETVQAGLDATIASTKAPAVTVLRNPWDPAPQVPPTQE